MEFRVVLGPQMMRPAPSSSVESTVVFDGNDIKQSNPPEPLFKKVKPKKKKKLKRSLPVNVEYKECFDKLSNPYLTYEKFCEFLLAAKGQNGFVVIQSYSNKLESLIRLCRSC